MSVLPQAGLITLLPEAFDNKAAWPDAVVEVDGREIHVHRMLLGLRCEPLAKMLNGESSWLARRNALPLRAFALLVPCYLG